jgi:O-acetyl-ADP-ribose deacetylase (regulator of RNase III)
MEIILTALDRELLEAWKKFCGDLEHVTVYHGSILEVECDAVVSPANSFGFMDGGIDLLYSRYFGWEVQKRLQSLIKQRHHGELLVGAAEIVSTDNSEIPYAIAAPTMRVPMILRDTVNPYLAARATLLLVKYSTFPDGPNKGQYIMDHVKSLAFPGLGTGVGQVGSNTCASQVRQAIEEVLQDKYTFPKTWSEAQSRHQKLYTNFLRDLQRE